MGLTPFGYISIIFALILIYPSIKLYRNYLITKVQDYLIFSLFFIFSILSAVGVILRNIAGDMLISWQFHGFIIFTLYLIIFIHATHVRWIKTPPIIWYTIIIWYLILIGMIPFYELILDQPDEGKFLIWDNFPRSYNNDHPNGAGIVLSDGTYIFSQSFQLLGDLFRITITLILLYVYIQSKPEIELKSTIQARKYFIISWVFGLMYMFALLPITYKFIPLPPSFFILIFTMIIFSISIKYPESVLITKSQILQASFLYDKIENLDDNQKENFEIPSLIDYISYLKKEKLISP